MSKTPNDLKLAKPTIQNLLLLALYNREDQKVIDFLAVHAGFEKQPVLVKPEPREIDRSNLVKLLTERFGPVPAKGALRPDAPVVHRDANAFAFKPTIVPIVQTEEQRKFIPRYRRGIILGILRKLDTAGEVHTFQRPTNYTQKQFETQVTGIMIRHTRQIKANVLYAKAVIQPFGDIAVRVVRSIYDVRKDS